MLNTYLKNNNGEYIYFNGELVQIKLDELKHLYKNIKFRTVKNSHLKTAIFNAELESGVNFNLSIEDILERNPKTKWHRNIINLKSILDNGYLNNCNLSSQYTEFLLNELGINTKISDKNKSLIDYTQEANNKSDTHQILKAIVSSFYTYHISNDGGFPADFGQLSRVVLIHELIRNGYKNFEYLPIFYQLVLHRTTYKLELKNIADKSVQDITSYIVYMLGIMIKAVKFDRELANINLKTGSIRNSDVERLYIMYTAIKDEHKILNRKSYKKEWNRLYKNLFNSSINEQQSLEDLFILMKYDFVVPHYVSGIYIYIYQGFKYFKD